MRFTLPAMVRCFALALGLVFAVGCDGGGDPPGVDGLGMVDAGSQPDAMPDAMPDAAPDIHAGCHARRIAGCHARRIAGCHARRRRRMPCQTPPGCHAGCHAGCYADAIAGCHA
jgi:hypothetical protein